MTERFVAVFRKKEINLYVVSVVFNVFNLVRERFMRPDARRHVGAVL